MKFRLAVFFFSCVFFCTHIHLWCNSELCQEDDISKADKVTFTDAEKAIDTLLDPNFPLTDDSKSNLKLLVPHVEIFMKHREFSEKKLIERFYLARDNNGKYRILALLTWAGMKPTIWFSITSLREKNGVDDPILFQHLLELLSILVHPYPDENGCYVDRIPLTNEERKQMREQISKIKPSKNLSKYEKKDAKKTISTIIERLSNVN